MRLFIGYINYLLLAERRNDNLKLIEIWKLLGKQPLRVTQHKESIVFVDGEEYIVSNMKYDSGKFIGFETKPRYEWFSEMMKPEICKKVIVIDDDCIEHKNYYWNSEDWYNEKGEKSKVNICSWRYQ